MTDTERDTEQCDNDHNVVVSCDNPTCALSIVLHGFYHLDDDHHLMQVLDEFGWELVYEGDEPLMYCPRCAA